MTEPRWLTVEEVRRLHALQIDESGETPRIRDARLESAVLRPQRHHRGELKTIVDLAVAYATALSGNHPFFNGNKRVAFHAIGRASEAELTAWVRSRV